MNALLVALLLHAEPLANGSLIPLELKVGTVTVEVQARLVPCMRGRRCAQLPSGRRVQGRIECRPPGGPGEPSERFVVEETP